MAQEATVTRGVETAYRESAVGIKEDCFFFYWDQLRLPCLAIEEQTHFINNKRFLLIHIAIVSPNRNFS